MKRFIVAGLLFCSCRCASADVSRAVIKDAIARNVLIMDKTPGSDKYCSGVIIGASQVLTAGHCYSDALTVNGLPAKVIKRDEQLDLLLLQIETGKTALVIGDPSIGDQVVAVANRAPYVGLLNYGRVSKIDPLFISMLAVPGFSGAGVFGADGRLVGLVVGVKTAATDFAEIPMFAIVVKGSDLRKFIES